MATPEVGAVSQDTTPTLDADGKPVPTRKGPGRDPKLSERDALLARMDEKIIAGRAADDEEFLASADVDPRAAMLAAQMAREARGQKIDTDAGDEPTAEVEREDPDAGAGDAAAAAAREATRISHKGTDPLGDYVVRVEGKPMFKTLVDGKEVLVPLDRARAQLQKHLAADIRLQQAAEQKRQLDAREQSIRNVEATLKTRSTHPSATVPVVDDSALATELVRSLVSEPEDKAAAKLASAFKSIRQAQAPVDLNAIASQAAREAMATIAARDHESALSNGLDEFTKNYPDIASDSDLFTLADKRTTAIAEANPTWKPGQVMLEAGKQTREWLKSIGAPVRAASGEQPSNRQQRKQNLVPMPQARTARPAPAEGEIRDQTPAEAMAEIRKSRGQSY
jgi:hypothetical protein